MSFTNMYVSNKNYITENRILNPIMKGICHFLDFHDITHHDSTINKRWYNIVYEFVNNFVMQGGLIIIIRYILYYYGCYFMLPFIT